MKDRPKRSGRTKQVIEEELACVLAILDGLTDAEIEAAQARGIPYDERKAMTAQQVRARWEFDHGIHHVIGGPAKHWNFTPRRPLGHSVKTHTIDRPQIRKTDRVSKKQEEFRRRLLAKSDPDVEVSTTRTGPKLRSRGFQKPPEGHKHRWGSRKMGKRA